MFQRLLSRAGSHLGILGLGLSRVASSLQISLESLGSIGLSFVSVLSLPGSVSELTKLCNSISLGTELGMSLISGKKKCLSQLNFFMQYKLNYGYSCELSKTKKRNCMISSTNLCGLYRKEANIGTCRQLACRKTGREQMALLQEFSTPQQIPLAFLLLLSVLPIKGCLFHSY